jgi:hypothetical protein
MTPTLEPKFIPSWPGRDPLRYWVSPEMRQFWPELQMALMTLSAPRERVWLRFNEVADPGMLRCIDFRLESLVNLLGLGFYPPPLNKEPEAGNVIVNRDSFIQPAFRPLVLPTLIHEIAAHSLGLGHLWLRGSVRCPWIEEGRINLSAEDRASLLTMYGV